jgi:5'-nucleotidase
MAYPLKDKLVVGISGRALFNLEEAHQVFEKEGLEAFNAHQRERENVPLELGTGFPLVKSLLSINQKLDQRAVEVVVISRNHGDSALRLMNSIERHGLDITRASFCGGRNPDKYFAAYECKLFLSAEEEDVQKVLFNGGAAALVFKPPVGFQHDPNEVRIAFDGDAVIFSDEAERIYQEQGLTSFLKSEVAQARIPLSPGPFKPFLLAVSAIQKKFKIEESPIRTAVVTARNAPAHERAIRTLRHWGIAVDEMHFLGGVDKAGVLQAFNPHIFFDDQQSHIVSCGTKVPSAQVLSGIAAKKKPPVSVPAAAAAISEQRG